MVIENVSETPQRQLLGDFGQKNQEIEPSVDWEMKLKKQREMEKSHFSAKLAKAPKLYAYVCVSSTIKAYIYSII